MPKLGQIVYYRREAVEAVYPAIVTGFAEDGRLLDLTVFTTSGQLFPRRVPHGVVPGCWRYDPPGEDEDGPVGGDIVIVQMPGASARDELAAAAQVAGQARISDATLVVATWPNGDFEVVKRGEIHCPVKLVNGRSNDTEGLTMPNPVYPGELLEDLAKAVARRVTGEDQEAAELLDRYAVETGREQCPDEIWQAMSRASGS